MSCGLPHNRQAQCCTNLSRSSSWLRENAQEASWQDAHSINTIAPHAPLTMPLAHAASWVGSLADMCVRSRLPLASRSLQCQSRSGAFCAPHPSCVLARPCCSLWSSSPVPANRLLFQCCGPRTTTRCTPRTPRWAPTAFPSLQQATRETDQPH